MKKTHEQIVQERRRHAEWLASLRPPKRRFFRPPGVTIYQSTDPKYRGLRVVCSIKSRGRTGALARSRLMALSAEQRVPVLEAWLRGHSALL